MPRQMYVVVVVVAVAAAAASTSGEAVGPSRRWTLRWRRRRRRRGDGGGCGGSGAAVGGLKFGSSFPCFDEDGEKFPSASVPITRRHLSTNQSQVSERARGG